MDEFNIINQLKDREQYLTSTIHSLEQTLKQVPEGTLRIVTSHAHVQCFVRDSQHPRNGTYIRKSNSGLASQLAQKEYNLAALAALTKELHATRKYLASMEKAAPLKDIYSKLPPLKQKLVTPLELPDDLYRKLWEDEAYEGLPFDENDDTEYYTDKGERVRSKSEILIGNALFHMNIPYHYEKPLHLIRARKTIYPDFTVLDMKTRQNVYIEHLGRMSDLDYVEKNLLKILDYQADGYYPGEQLILFHETNFHALNTQLMKKTLVRYFL